MNGIVQLSYWAARTRNTKMVANEKMSVASEPIFSS
jgi:hypothetical protein